MTPSLPQPVPERSLADAIAIARQTWPDVAVAVDEFRDHVDSRLAGDRFADPASLNVTDLYLAFACSRGDAFALAAMESECRREVTRSIARIRPAGVTADDALQLILEKLFVGQAGRAPRILDYGGRGSLRSWTRAIVIRAVIDLARSHRREEREVAIDALGVLPSPELDPALAHLKQTCRAQFERAFEAAVAALDPAERNTLRQHLIHGLSIDQIGALYGIHRATAARRVAAARQRLLDETRGRLRRNLQVSATELDSILRLVDSQLEISVARLLRSRNETSPLTRSDASGTGS